MSHSIERALVSVPVRGNGFESLLRCALRPFRHGLVSVPVRGNGFESLSSIISLVECEEFPSPLGVMDLKEVETRESGTFLNKEVSVPVRGNGFERVMVWQGCKAGNLRFRPR